LSEQNRELVRRQFEDVFNKQDLAACDEIFASDYVEHARAPFQPSEPGKVNGPEHMRGVVAWLRSQFSDIEMTVEAIVADGDLVAARIRTTGTNDGKLNGMIPPTGKSFDAMQSHWFRVEDGKLAEHWATRDDLTSMFQLGLVSPPGGGQQR
jgi:predicted ester cyclase